MTTNATPESTTSERDWLQDLQSDFGSSIVVFLVALPLCMGIAIASGYPPEKAAASGIISGIIGGFLVGSLAGCSLQVTGPAAGLAVIVGQLITAHGMQTLGLIIMVAGAIQLLAAVLRLGQWFRAVSPAIIEGMLAGIGILIFAAQFHVMVDDSPPGSGRSFGGVINLFTIPEAVWKGLTEPQHQAAAIVGVVTILCLIGWSCFAPERLSFLPAPLFSVIVATGLAAVLEQFDLDPHDIKVPDSLLDVVSIPTWTDLPKFLDRTVLTAGATVAFIASAESLLTASAVDTMQQHTPRTNYDRELAAQGAGNFLCGFLGVLPLTGVIVRSATNVQAGGRTRLATVLHGVWLLVFAVAFPFILRLVPVASLAAILVYTGARLVKPKVVNELLEFGWGEVAVYAATVATVVFIDLLVGIGVGVALSLFQLVYRFTHLDIRLEERIDEGRTIMHLEGAATFVRLPQLAAVLETVPPSTELHVHIEELRYIDHACLELLINWEKQHAATGGSLVIDWESLTAKFHPFKKNGTNNHAQPPSTDTLTDPKSKPETIGPESGSSQTPKA